MLNVIHVCTCRRRGLDFYYSTGHSRVHFCQEGVQSFVQVSKITWEELEKVGLRHFANLRKTQGRNGRGLYHEIQKNSLKAWI